MCHVSIIRTTSYGFFLTALLLLTGCGASNIGTVTGSVNLDGKPLDGGSVTFYPVSEGAISYADVSTAGAYELRTASRTGVAPGAYIATVSYRSGRPGPGMTIRQIEALEKVPIKYCQKDTSDLRFEITAGHNEVDLNLVSTK